MTKPIVGIGELLWDIYPDGRKVAGGAPFNFAFHCHQLGHEAVIVSRVGDDDLGRELRERVRDLGLSDEFIQTDHEHPTGTVRVALDGNAVPNYTIAENVAWDYIAENDQLDVLGRKCAAVCFGTMAQRRRAPHPFQIPLVQNGPAFRIFDVNLRPTFDRQRLKYFNLQLVDLIKVNEAELRILASYRRRPSTPPPPSRPKPINFGPIDEDLPRNRVTTALQLLDGSVEELVASLYRTLTNKRTLFIITRGEDGALVFGDSNHSVPIHEPGVPAKVIDTVGAGDAFTAAMVCLHLEGRPLLECARFANHYAARVCEHMGATPRIDRAEVERAAGLAPC